MSGRISGVVGRTPISDRIKLFDGGSGGVTRKTPPIKPKTAVQSSVPFSSRNLKSATTTTSKTTSNTSKEAVTTTTKSSPSVTKDPVSNTISNKATRTDSNSSTKSDTTKSSSSKSQSTKTTATDQKTAVSRQLASSGGKKTLSSSKGVKKGVSPSNSISGTTNTQSSKSKTTVGQSKSSSKGRVSLTKLEVKEEADTNSNMVEEEICATKTRSNSSVDEIVAVISSTAETDSKKPELKNAIKVNTEEETESLSPNKCNVVSFADSENVFDDDVSPSSRKSSQKSNLDEIPSLADCSEVKVDETISRSSSKSSINGEVTLSSFHSSSIEDVSSIKSEIVSNIASQEDRVSEVNDDESLQAPIIEVNIENKLGKKLSKSEDTEENQANFFKQRKTSVGIINVNEILNCDTYSDKNLNNKGEIMKDLYFSDKLKNDDLLKDMNYKNKVDNESVINNNYANITDNQYFTNQALKNVNSATLSQAMKLEYKDDKITNLTKQLEEMEASSVSEEEIKNLKKLKHDLDCRLREQEDELDDMASQVQLLESGKAKMEMQLQQLKKDQRKELESKEDELEDLRAATAKKVKILEQQLEQEHEERVGFLRERHELEGKIMNLHDMLERSGDEEQVAKLKKDLKKTKALLRDAQTMMDKTQTDGTNKVILRQLKNQLEDAEFARQAALKARQNAELELADVQSQLEDVSRAKADLDDKNLRQCREKADIATQLQETEEELQDVMRKYKASVAAVSTDQITIQDQAANIQELEGERNKLREQYAEISQRLDHMEGENVSSAQHKRLELKIRELESKMELDKTTRNRLETQISRGKEIAEKFQREVDDLKIKDAATVDEMKKQARQIRDLKEELSTLQVKEAEVSHKKADLDKQLEMAETETATVRNELKVANKRIEDLQAAISGEIDSDNNSDQDSDSSDEEVATFLDHHRRAMSVQRERESMQRDSVMRELRSGGTRDIRSMSREIRSSVARDFESATRDLHTLREARDKPEGIAEED